MSDKPRGWKGELFVIVFQAVLALIAVWLILSILFALTAPHYAPDKGRPDSAGAALSSSSPRR